MIASVDASRPISAAIAREPSQLSLLMVDLPFAV